MPKFTLALRQKQSLAEGTMAFGFELPAPPFGFKPGQFVSLALSSPPYQDAKGNVRSFSIASAPGEPVLTIATRLTGTAFKRSLAEMADGGRVNVSGPYGSFTLEDNPAPPAALFAGGIGITPFRSMIKHAVQQRATRPLTLFYSNRRPEDAAFLDELQAWEKTAPNFRLVATMTQPEKSSRAWTGRTGYIDAGLVKECLPDLSKCRCYAAGPPRFVAAVVEELTLAGVSKEAIRSDEFDGY